MNSSIPYSVYICRCKNFPNLYKIGKAQYPDERVRRLQRLPPYNAYFPEPVVAFSATSLPLERLLHMEFVLHEVRGEDLPVKQSVAVRELYAENDKLLKLIEQMRTAPEEAFADYNSKAGDVCFNQLKSVTVNGNQYTSERMEQAKREAMQRLAERRKRWGM